MELKGNYAAETSYSVGDVVRYNDIFYHLQKATKAGTPPTDTLYWGRLDQVLAWAADLIMDALEIAETNHVQVVNNLTTTAAGKALDARQGKALKELIDTLGGTVSGIGTTVTGLSTSVGNLYPDAKTIVLASSTSESTKTFAITVDDDGELTATEITAQSEET